MAFPAPFQSILNQWEAQGIRVMRADWTSTPFSSAHAASSTHSHTIHFGESFVGIFMKKSWQGFREAVRTQFRQFGRQFAIPVLNSVP